MPRKQDSIYSVMDFFEREPLAVAQSTLSLVKRIVQKRGVQEATVAAAPVKRRVRGKNKPKPQTTVGGPGPALVQAAEPAKVAESSADATATPAPKAAPRRRVRKPAAPVATTADRAAPAPPPPAAGAPDLALPGLGPSTIGD